MTDLAYKGIKAVIITVFDKFKKLGNTRPIVYPPCGQDGKAWAQKNPFLCSDRRRHCG